MVWDRPGTPGELLLVGCCVVVQGRQREHSSCFVASTATLVVITALVVAVAVVAAAAQFDRSLFIRLSLLICFVLSVLRRHLGHEEKAESALAHFGAEE